MKSAKFENNGLTIVEQKNVIENSYNLLLTEFRRTKLETFKGKCFMVGVTVVPVQVSKSNEFYINC